MKVGGSKNNWGWIILVLIGGILGSIVGDLLSTTWPVLKQGPAIGLQPVNIDLHVVRITFGLLFKVNLASAIGMILGYILYRRF